VDGEGVAFDPDQDSKSLKFRHFAVLFPATKWMEDECMKFVLQLVGF